MSSPVSAVTCDHTLAAAWEAMRRQGLHHLLVMDRYGLSAVLDDRTLAAAWPSGGPEAPHRHTVGEIVRHGVRSVGVDDRLDAVARVMVEGGCDAVPVVADSGAVLGLVTATDIVAAVARGAVTAGGR